MICEGSTKLKKSSSLLLITSLFFSTFLTFKTFKKVNFHNITIYGSKLFSIDDIAINSSLNLPTPLIFVKTKYHEKELKKNLSLKNVSIYRQIFPFGLKIQIKTRTPIAYGERIFKGEKLSGFIDEHGFFINEKFSEKENLGNLSTKVYGWEENFRITLSEIFKSQKNNNIEFVTINFSPNGFLTLEEKGLKTILLGFDPTIIETQLRIICDLKNQLTGENILEKIDNIDLTDPNNPKIKVFKP